MSAEEIMDSEDFRKCVEFHGHLCPGLSMGFRAAKTAMERLNALRSEDEEIVAIVETDACCADAIQVLTGCTFGKGNFIYKDHGKVAVTLLSRNTGEGVRVVLKPDAFKPDPAHMALIQKITSGTADENDRKAFDGLHLKRTGDVLTLPEEKLFTVQKVNVELPARAQIAPSVPCDFCREGVMGTKLQKKNGKNLCRACAGG
ncbi:MAG: formylmethanofuran dehydrogenase [Desulfobacteraceae bacterium]|nr:formylmethanofuran dehydrogenase [Desulfobacteraceae bacterium]MBU4054053.1 formylmethanofuran dehydrogenase [Pseudomonadota bacterium]